MSAFNRKIPFLKTKNILCFLALYGLFHILCFASFAQTVTVHISDGGQITGSIQEYRNGVLKIKTEYGSLQVPAEDLVRIDFSDESKISQEAYHHLLSGQQFLELGMENEAMAEFEAAMHSSPLFAGPHYEIGLILEKRGEIREALKFFSRSIKLGLNLPGMAKHFLDVADAYLVANELEGAAETYYLLYQNFPDYSAADYAVYKSGFLFADELDNDVRALEILEDGIAEFPNSQHVERALYEVGRIREEQGMPEAAEAAVRQLILEFPQSQWISHAHYVLGKTCLQMRRNEEAIEEFARVVDEATDPALVTAADTMLNQCIWVVYDQADGLPSDDVRALAQDGNYIWIGTSNGIVRFDTLKNEFIDDELLKRVEIQALAVDDVHLWIGTLNSGLRRYNKAEGLWNPYTGNTELASGGVFSISIDIDYVWVGTMRNGVHRYNKFSGDWESYTTSQGLPAPNIVSIASTPAGTWCGAWKKGVCYFDAGRWAGDPGISSEDSVTVTSIAAGSDYVWFAWNGKFSNGISKYAAKSWELFPFRTTEGNEDVGAVNLAANDFEAWVGTDSHAMVYDYGIMNWIGPFDYPPKLAGDDISCVLISGDSVWFASPRGLAKLDKRLLRRIGFIRKQR